MKKVLMGLGIVALGYICYKSGYSAGSFDADPECQKLYKDYLDGNITFDEYLRKVLKRKEELNA